MLIGLIELIGVIELLSITSIKVQGLLMHQHGIRGIRQLRLARPTNKEATEFTSAEGNY